MTRKERGNLDLGNVTFREPRQASKKGTKDTELTDSGEFSSFLEIIEYDQDGKEKTPISTQVEAADAPVAQQQSQNSA
jgi:hypothetical protein